MKSDGLNSALSPVMYGDIVLSINTQKIQYIHTYQLTWNCYLVIERQVTIKHILKNISISFLGLT